MPPDSLKKLNSAFTARLGTDQSAFILDPCLLHILHIPLVVLVQILFCLFDLVCGCNPYRKLDEILLRQLGMKQVPFGHLV